MFSHLVLLWKNLARAILPVAPTQITRRVRLTDLDTKVNLIEPETRVLYIVDHESRVEV